MTSDARPCDGTGRILIGGEAMGWWEDCKGCVNCADELVIDRIWRRGGISPATYRARVKFNAGEWQEIELPVAMAERVIADLKVAMADLRKLLDG